MAKKNVPLWTDSVVNLLTYEVSCLIDGLLPRRDYAACVAFAHSGEATWPSVVPFNMIAAEKLDELGRFVPVVESVRVLAGSATQAVTVETCDRAVASYAAFVIPAGEQNAALVVRDPRKKPETPKGAYPMAVYFRVKG